MTLITHLYYDYAMTDHIDMIQELKDKAISEYWDACKLPRKKKKKARKSANLLYSIACNAENIYKNNQIKKKWKSFIS